jgi:ParB family chromosome partitioning protein
MAGERRSKRTESDQVASLEQELRIALGTKIEIRQSKKGRGKIVVHFSDHDEFDRLRALLNGTATLRQDQQGGDQEIA